MVYAKIYNKKFFSSYCNKEYVTVIAFVLQHKQTSLCFISNAKRFHVVTFKNSRNLKSKSIVVVILL